MQIWFISIAGGDNINKSIGIFPHTISWVVCET